MFLIYWRIVNFKLYFGRIEKGFYFILFIIKFFFFIINFRYFFGEIENMLEVFYGILNGSY